MNKSVLLGGLVGIAGFLYHNGWYSVTSTLLFPSLNTPVFQNVQANLDEKATPQAPRLSYQPLAQSSLLELAQSVFESKDAQVYAEIIGKLQVQKLGTTRLQLRINSWNSLSALTSLKKLQLYYRDFLQKSALSQTNRARLLLERELGELSPRIDFLEKQVRRARDLSNPIGDALMDVDTVVMQEIWSKRVEGSITSQATSDFFRDLLQGAGKNITSKTLSTSLSVRQVQLERTYGDCVALRRALLNEYSQIRLLERLDNPDFEVLEEPHPDPLWRFRLIPYGLTGMLLGWIVQGILQQSSRKGFVEPSKKGTTS